MLDLTRSKTLGYTSSTPQPSRRGQSLQNTVAGIGLLNAAAAQSRNTAQSCGFYFCASSFGGSNVGPQGRRNTASAAAPVDQPVRAATPIGLGVAVVQTAALEAIMAKSNTSRASTRCKPGDRARIISARIPKNRNSVVAVVRRYKPGEIVAGADWTCDGAAWVVVALGNAITSFDIKTGALTQGMTAVFGDAQLMPLRDDEGGIEDSVACGLTKGVAQ